MSACACMGPQRGAPLCPCRMREAESYLERFKRIPLTPLQLSTIIGGPLAGWYDISSAPRNGEHILACDGSISFGWMDGKPLPPVQTVVHWFPDPEEPGFYTSVNETEPQRTFPATHWKPLDAPASPATPIGGLSLGDEGDQGVSVAGLPAHVADATATDTKSHTGKED